MKRNINVILALMLVLAANLSFAGVSVNGKIKEILVGPNYGNLVLLKIDKLPAIVGCQTNVNFNYAFDGTTSQGKMYLSVVLAAHAANKDVVIAGYNTCGYYPGINDLYHLVIK